MMDYPPISQKAWCSRIAAWNSKKTTNRREMADRCRKVGHHMFRSPVGPWCGRCCQYFREEGD